MKHVYKLGGNWKAEDGTDYEIKAVSEEKFHVYLADGWFSCLEDAMAIDVTPESGSDYEAELRDKIKALGGKAGGRSSIETLEKQLKELEDGSNS